MPITQTTLPTVPEIFEAASIAPDYVVRDQHFLPNRYPFTYAYDFVRTYVTDLVPTDVVDECVSYDGTAYNGSRGMTARLLENWADANGWDHKALVLNFADAALIEESRPLPETSPNLDLVAKGSDVKVSEVRREAGESALTQQLDTKGLRVSKDEVREIFDAMLAAMNA